MKNYNLLSFLFLIWLIIKKINSKIENIFLKNTNQQNDDEYETINLEPYKIERIIYEESFYFKYDCNTSCNDVYFSIDKGNEYGTGIYIYDDYKNIKKTDKALFTFITGINIRKNELLHFDFGEKKIIYITISSLFKKNNNNLNYFYMFHNSGKIINVNSYLEKNLCYKINKGGNYKIYFNYLFDGYNYLHMQLSNTKKTIEAYITTEDKTEKIEDNTKINKYFTLTNNSFLSFKIGDDNDDVDLDVSIDFYNSYYLNITKESTEYSRLLLSPGIFLFFSGIDNINDIGHFLLTFNYNKNPINKRIECEISDDENDIKFIKPSNETKNIECNIIKDNFYYENYHIYFKLNETLNYHRIIIIKLIIENDNTFTKQYFSIYKSYPTFELNMESKERNISLSKNPYFFKINLNNEIFNNYSKILLLTNDNTVMSLIEGEFTSENYNKSMKEKIKYIHILNIKELKNLNKNIITIMFHTSVPYQKTFFYYKCYTDDVHFIINNEEINKEKKYKIEINDCVNEKYYYFGIYKKRNENIAFVDYHYGIGEIYQSSHMDPFSLEKKFEYKKFNDSISPLTQFSYLKSDIQIYSIECYSPILVYLSLIPYLTKEKNILEEGEKYSFYLTEKQEIDFNITKNLINTDNICYEINLIGNNVNLDLTFDNKENINYNKSGLFRNEINTKSISFKNKGNDTSIIFKIGKKSGIYIGNLNKDSYNKINDEKILIINVTREENYKFKELKVSFLNEDDNIDVCLYFGLAKYPYINIPTDICVNFEKKKTKDFQISYPFEKVNNSHLKDDDYYLIFSFPKKIIVPIINIIKKEESIEIYNHTQKIIKDKLDTQNYIIKSSLFEAIKNKGLFICISFFSDNNNYKSLNYILSYSNKIIHQNQTLTNLKSGRLYYSLQDNFINYDLKITSNISYNIFITRFTINYTYQFNFITNDFTIYKNADNYSFYPILNENVYYVVIYGTTLESVNDYSKVLEGQKIYHNFSDTEVTFNIPVNNKKGYYVNVIAVQLENYESKFFYESFHYESDILIGKSIFIFLLIFFLIVLIIVVIFKKEKIDQSVIEDQIESDLPLVQT